MRKIEAEIRESYTYDSYEEFINHYNEMIKLGFKPRHDSSNPAYYVGVAENLSSYVAAYEKQLQRD